ncbi:hypothetical protein [Jeongeupia chitinilytica]|uniref:Uncharacterized protein n=1 Tax=Jeongeupia chitinilytica TaxID=1041641 RepID=A0ABQ3GXG9_9NEIS|nr:hypothetical protein [Jeongeupia chitinilytica]GHD57108.1 hypothetical protein GCM10007350_05290 [Jeongeupia chitinilytica]
MRHQLIEQFVNEIIRMLQLHEFFQESPQYFHWKIIENTALLHDLQAAAAATCIDNTPTMILANDWDLECDSYAIAHETIHLAQILKGDLVPIPHDGANVMWKGKKFRILNGDAEDYYSAQPWEGEAREFLNKLGAI